MLDHDRRDFSFRHSFANVLQYFNLSSNNFAEGPLTCLLLLKPHPFWLIVAVPTTSADASLPSPRVKSSFPSQPTDRNTADDKSDVLESLLLAFSPYRIVSPRLLLQGYVPALDRVWLRRHHDFESCWCTFRGIFLLKQNQNLVCFVCLQ